MIYFSLLCQNEGTHKCMGLFLGFLPCSIGLYFCFCASTILSWWLQLCSIIWSQEVWFLQLHPSFARLLWLFGVFSVSIWIVKFFVLVLWKMPLVIWQWSHWICRLHLVIQSFSEYWFFLPRNMEYLSICLCCEDNIFKEHVILMLLKKWNRTLTN